MNKQRKLAHVGPDCVACGCCVPVCPKTAIRIQAGIMAQVNDLACIGCGKCAAACPAAVIALLARRDDV